ncbi:MAG: efflux transporter outer membrane subunit [Acidobacteriota bacterium]
MLGLLVLSSAACTVGPDFEQPATQTRPDWSARVESPLTSEPVDEGDWWRSLGDPDLDRLVEQALASNLSLQIAGVRLLEARAQLGIARGTLWPQRQAAEGRASLVELSENASNLALSDPSFTDYHIGFDAAWELDFWGRIRRGVESADASYRASAADSRNAVVAVAAEVARAYVLLRTFERRLQLAERNAALQRDSLRIADVRFRNGLVPELDVTQARSLLKDTEAVVPRLEAGVRQTLNGLATLLGQPPGSLDGLLDGERTATIPAPPARVAVGTPIDLLRRRPDIRRAEFEAAAQSARIGVAEAELYPRFTLLGSIGLVTSSGAAASSNGATSGDLFRSSSLTYSVGPTFSWPILNYGRLRNQVRVEHARFLQLALRYQQTVLDAAREVEDALVAFLAEQATALLLEESVKNAERSVELALSQYRAGLVNYQAVVDTQRFLVQQQDRAVESRGDVVLSLVAAYKALGGGWNRPTDGWPVLSAEIQEALRRTGSRRVAERSAAEVVHGEEPE